MGRLIRYPNGATEQVLTENEKDMRSEVKNLINYLNENPEKAKLNMLGINCEMNGDDAFFVCFNQNKIIITKSGKQAGSIILRAKERTEILKIHLAISKANSKKRNEESLNLIQEILDETNEAKQS